ncbi:MAG: carboxypeptidase-like regulatory domain-containing protein [Bacteroidetes bacterium]|nr:carboxypeptidase-like regulatory domain-containing protein [Bacteroidota bacterium]
MTTHEHKPDTAIAPIDTPVTACDTMLTGICGRILDETGEGLIGATVQVIDTNGKTTGQGAVADIDGNFTLALRDTGTVTLRATYVGYETQVLTARPTTHPYMTIRMKEDTVNFGNMVGIMVIHRTPAQKVKAWFRHSFYTLTHLREYREYKLARQRMKD